MQTSNGATNLCSCYHDESLHQSPPMPDALNHQVHHPQAPIPFGHPLFLPPLARPTLPATAAPRPNHGIPSNQATSILRAFQPLRGHPSSTSEENRQKSITRTVTRQTNKKKTKAALLASEPVDMEVSILLLPLNVRVFRLC